jgi:hypothetical protein
MSSRHVLRQLLRHVYSRHILQYVLQHVLGNVYPTILLRILLKIPQGRILRREGCKVIYLHAICIIQRSRLHGDLRE